MIEFDEAKAVANLAKHGLPLSLAEEMDMFDAVILADQCKDYGEARFRAFGRIEGRWHCLVFTLRGDAVRAISLRHAHAKEIKRYAPQR